jgi:hypothetical protein
VFEPILVFTGAYTTADTTLGIPYVDVLTHGREMADLVEGLVQKKV